MENGVIFQSFHWYYPGGQLWNDLAARAQKLADAGFTAVWIPPTGKGAGGNSDVGYGAYDLFDLGEFDQKSTVATKYGTKAELLAAIQALQGHGLQVYADVVFNHKAGGDSVEQFWAQEVDWDERNRATSDWYPIHSYTYFGFPGRKGAYSTMEWHWWCFDALAYNADTGNTKKLYRLRDKTFSTEVSPEYGNYEFLMANDLDLGEPFVRGELMWWGRWFIDTTGCDGFRIDAVKHIRSSWFRDWLNHLRTHFGGRELFSVGEYWSQDVADLHNYLSASEGVMSLFDVPLHYRFHWASQQGSSFDMRTLWDGTLMKEQPGKAVTFVENHDTQPCQALLSPVEPWFKPLAYAFILLRREGYPVVFEADYDSATYQNCLGGYPDVQLYSHRFLIDVFLTARRDYGFGDQHDYFDHPNTIGWIRLGSEAHPGAMAVVMTNGTEGSKWMNTFRPDATFHDATQHFRHTVTTNAEGWGEFACRAGSVSVWLQD